MSASRAVLWDMDGTLIDSEEFHWISWRDTLANEGIAITHEQFLSSFGQRNDSILPRWLGTAATPERIERIANATTVPTCPLMLSWSLLSFWSRMRSKCCWRAAPPRTVSCVRTI